VSGYLAVVCSEPWLKHKPSWNKANITQAEDRHAASYMDPDEKQLVQECDYLSSIFLYPLQLCKCQQVT
jgi:hypothetical protein